MEPVVGDETPRGGEGRGVGRGVPEGNASCQADLSVNRRGCKGTCRFCVCEVTVSQGARLHWSHLQCLCF